jgi:hypothetical protein
MARDQQAEHGKKGIFHLINPQISIVGCMDRPSINRPMRVCPPLKLDRRPSGNGPALPVTSRKPGEARQVAYNRTRSRLCAEIRDRSKPSLRAVRSDHMEGGNLHANVSTKDLEQRL